jgi:hypothetical protein
VNTVSHALPFRFRQPDDTVMGIIVDELQKLSIHSESEILSKLEKSRRRESRRDNLSGLRAALRNALDLDFAELLTEDSNAPYNFEYVVDKYCAAESNVRNQWLRMFTMPFARKEESKGRHEGLSIFTRLFARHQEKSGSIFYGRIVFRIGDDAFLYWLE